MKNLGKGKPQADYILKKEEFDAGVLDNELIADGSTVYFVDTKKYKMFYDGDWYDM